MEEDDEGMPETSFPGKAIDSLAAEMLRPFLLPKVGVKASPVFKDSAAPKSETKRECTATNLILPFDSLWCRTCGPLEWREGALLLIYDVSTPGGLSTDFQRRLLVETACRKISWVLGYWVKSMTTVMCPRRQFQILERYFM